MYGLDFRITGKDMFGNDLSGAALDAYHEIERAVRGETVELTNLRLVTKWLEDNFGQEPIYHFGFIHFLERAMTDAGIAFERPKTVTEMHGMVKELVLGLFQDLLLWLETVDRAESKMVAVKTASDLLLQLSRYATAYSHSSRHRWLAA